MNIPSKLPNLHHVVWKYPLGARKHFFPGGAKVFIRTFQSCFEAERDKIALALGLIRDYGLGDKTLLGKKPLFMDRQLAEYLYDKAIHPRFFSAALHLIGREAANLKESAQRIQLRNLNRESLDRALKERKITADKIGRDFSAFEQQSTDNKLAILIKLRVITYADILPAQQTRPGFPEPRPRIQRVSTTELRADKSGQYRLPGIS
jgi:hypothetical protein